VAVQAVCTTRVRLATAPQLAKATSSPPCTVCQLAGGKRLPKLGTSGPNLRIADHSWPSAALLLALWACPRRSAVSCAEIGFGRMR
jgi:hypothetical protein